MNFLNELLYKTAIKNLVFKDFKVVIKTTAKKMVVIKALCFGEKYSFKKHGQFLELKAATYHCLKVYKRKNGFYTKIFFDV
ncbi:MAG: archease [Endomicrobiia bacterium]